MRDSSHSSRQPQAPFLGRFAGRHALVTGGASGIGFAVARRLIDEGCAVALLDRDAVQLASAAAELGLADASTCVADLGDPVAVERAVAGAAVVLGGSLDILVNAAGIYRIASILATDAAAWDEVLRINLRGTLLTSRAFAGPIALKQPSRPQPAAIVNFASVAAYKGSAAEPNSAYSASKAGVVALTRQMAVEWASLGIRVVAVAPGLVDTPMLRLMDDPRAGRAYLNSAVPLRRLGTAEEIAAVACFLASEDAAYITGEVVTVDGGLRAE